MAWMELELLLFSILLIYFVDGQNIGALRMKECKKSGDYLWKKSSAKKFFFCYQAGYAVSMECLDKQEMCKVPGEVFASCMCKGKDTKSIFYDKCQERFRKLPDTNRSGGILQKELDTIVRCEDHCLKTVYCVGYVFRQESNTCTVFYHEGSSSGLLTENGVVFYLKKPCALKFGYKHREIAAKSEGRLSSTTPSSPTGEVNPELKEQGAAAGGPAVYPKQVEGKQIDGSAYPHSHGYNQYDEDTTTPSAAKATTTTIPDSGCPYGLKKYEGLSHPGGRMLKHVADLEECKNWCLNLGYCKGIDYNIDQGVCYYHRVLEDTAMEPNANVWHIRKEPCQPPLKCWSQISYNSSNVDPTTPQIPCQGSCFVREKIFNTYTVFERGCHVSNEAPKTRCTVDKTLSGLTCFCQTDRCNGLSLAAQAAVLLHLPLDGHLNDVSGLDRHGQVAMNFGIPKTSCLEKAINCSMVFHGQQCISVPSMASQAYGDVNLENVFTAMLTVSVWFKAAKEETPSQRGILGNAWSSGQEPTWAFRTSSLAGNLVEAGISTISDSFEPDFKYIVASPDRWHHLAMIYDSTMDIENSKFPTLRVYLDGEEVDGNMQADMGNIIVRKEPLTVGCLMGQGFVGCIDDVRVFAMALDEADIQALLQMNDALYH